jgi:hypothetical protein
MLLTNHITAAARLMSGRNQLIVQLATCHSPLKLLADLLLLLLLLPLLPLLLLLLPLLPLLLLLPQCTPVIH